MIETMARIVIVADDLTGAADSAVGFAGRAGTVVSVDPAAGWPQDAAVVAVDTDSRYAPPDLAATLVTAATARGVAAGARVVKKIDSTLRGNVAAEVAAAAAAVRVRGDRRGALAVIAPAFPGTGRTTREGIVHVAGRPLPDRRHGGDIAALLAEGGLTARGFGLDVVRDPPALRARFAQAYADGLDAVICDGDSDADLAAVVVAAEEARHPVLLVGSGGITAALAAAFGEGPVMRAPVRAPVVAPPGPSLAVVGSYSGLARAQRAALVAAGWTPVAVAPGAAADDVHMAVTAVRAGLAGGGDIVLSPDPDAPVDRGLAPATARVLATVTAAALGGADAAAVSVVAVTGGETARAILAELGATEIRLVGELEPGVVAGRTAGTASLFVTKAGAFGDPDTLVRVLRAVSGSEDGGRRTGPGHSTDISRRHATASRQSEEQGETAT
jgi:D-threonate/D-erythronate kinase